MKIDYTDTPNITYFKDIKPGELFRNEDGEGLFLKIAPITNKQPRSSHTTAIVVESVDGPTGVGAGHSTAWADNDAVLPVKALHVEI